MMLVVIILVTMEFICGGFMVNHWLKYVSFNREADGLCRRLGGLPPSRAAVAVSNRLAVVVYNRNLHAKFVFVYGAMLCGLGIVMLAISGAIAEIM